MKNSDIFHISAQNIDCANSLEPPRRGGSNEYPQSMFSSRNKKNNVYPCKPQFHYIKVGLKRVKIIYACFRDVRGQFACNVKAYIFLKKKKNKKKKKNEIYSRMSSVEFFIQHINTNLNFFVEKQRIHKRTKFSFIKSLHIHITKTTYSNI